jgi:hypothetical protein
MVTIRPWEIYKCHNCVKNYGIFEIPETWQCPECNEPINIRFEINDRAHSCLRVNPSEIEEGDLVSPDGLNYYEVINCIEKGNSYRIALKSFAVININKDDFVLIINGSWFD